MKFIAYLLLAVAGTAHADWTGIGDVTAVQTRPDGAVLQAQGGALAVSAVAPGTVRLRYAPSGAFGRDHSWAVVSHTTSSARVEVADERVVVATQALRVVIARRPLRVEVFDEQGESIEADLADDGLAHNGERTRVARRLRDDEHVYGFGEKTGRLDKRGWALGGTHVAMWNSDTFAYDASTDPLYVSVPFYLVLRNGRAHGVFLDNAWRTHFDVGRDRRGALEFGADGGELDTYVIAGPDPKAVIERYTALTGRMPLPPRWTLGYHQSRWSYFPEARVRRLADTFRAERVPGDGLWLDIDYQQDYRPFTWDATRFPDPPRLLGDLKRQGFHVVTIVDPHPPVDANYRIWNEGRAGNHFVTTADGKIATGSVWPAHAAHDPADSAFPDFTRAATRDWWGAQYAALLDAGVAGIWNDMNEPSVWTGPGGTLPGDSRHDNDGEPAPHAAVHNVYGMQFNRATYEGLARLRPDARPFVLTRASFAGGQRYAAVWTGDNTSEWSSLRMSLPMLLGLSVSGFPFVGTDVGGFAGVPSPELYARWLQAAAFTPFFRSHTEFTTPDQEPWSYGADWTAINRRTIEQRYRLLPTLYSVMEAASRSGVPALRPLFLEFPQDPETASRDDEFLLGPDLLVAPVLAPGATEREVYLPPGRWYEYHSGKEEQGGKPLRVPVTLDTLPLYVRAGAFLFEQPVVQHTGQMAGQTLTARVYPAPASSGSLYEDDGASLAYRRGTYARRAWSQQREGAHITIDAARVDGSYRAAARELDLLVFGAARAARVQVDGRTLDRSAAVPGWSVEGDALRLRLRDRPQALRVSIDLGDTP